MSFFVLLLLFRRRFFPSSSLFSPTPSNFPKLLTHPFVRRLPEPVDPPQVVQRHAVPREEPTVDDERLAPDDVAERQRAEGVAEEVGEEAAVLGAHLAVEAVDAVHPRRLVVAAGQVQARRAEALVGEQRQDDLGRERAAVDKVAVEEEGVCIGGRAAGELEDVEEVVELAVDVAADLVFWWRGVFWEGERERG